MLQGLASAADDAASYDIFAAISTLKKWEDGKDVETDVQRSIDVKLRKLVCVSYSIVPKGADNATTKDLYKYLRESLEAVSTGMVSVFDLKASSADFNGELLKCLLKSIDTSSSAGHKSLDPHKAWDKLKYAKAWDKLKYAMLWGRDDLVHEQLSKVLHGGVLCMGLHLTVHQDFIAWLTGERLCFCLVCVCCCVRASASTSADFAGDYGGDPGSRSKQPAPRSHDLRLGAQQRSKKKRK